MKELSVDLLDVESSSAPLERPAFEKEPSQDTMNNYVRELDFLPDLTELTQQSWTTAEGL